MSKMWEAYTNRLSGLFSKKIETILIVDVSSDLKLLNVDLKDGNKISAIKIAELKADKKEGIILEALSNFIRENNIQHKNAILCPALSSYLIKRLQMPAVPDEELPQTLIWQVKDELAFDSAKAVLDYQIIRRITREDGAGVLDVICAAAEEEEVRKQVFLLKQLGFTCQAVNLLPFGYAKLIEKYFAKENKEACGVLHILDDACYVAIYKGGKLDFYREIPVTINKFRESLSDTIVTDKGRVQLTPDEINEALFSIGIPFDIASSVERARKIESASYRTKMGPNQVLGIWRPELERLSQEIKRSIIYYKSQFQGEEVKKLFIGGKGVKMPSLDKFLNSEMAIDVSFISLIEKISSSSAINTLLLSESYAAFGLSLDFTKGINLLPHEFKTEKIELAQKISLRLISVIIFSLLVVSYIFGRAAVGLYQKRLDNASLHLTILAQVSQMKARIDSFGGFVNEVRNLDSPAGSILKKLSGVAPRDLFFDGLDINIESKSGAISGYIKGTAANPDAVLTKLVNGMKESPYLKDTTIASFEKSTLSGAEVMRFKLTFKLP